MIEQVILEYLSQTLCVPVSMEKLENEETFVLLEKTGSSKENQIHSATIAIQSYANSLHEAAVLNEDVKKAMDNIVSLDSISSAKLNTDYNFTDTTTKRYRYQAIYDLFY